MSETFSLDINEEKIKKEMYPFEPWRCSDRLTFVTVTTGHLHIHIASSKVTLHSEQGVFIPPHTVFALYHDSECDVLIYSIHPNTFLSIDGSFLNEEYFLPWLNSHDTTFKVLSPYVMKQKEILDQLSVIRYLNKQKRNILDLHIRILWIVQLLIPKNIAKKGRKTELYCAEFVTKDVEKEYTHKFDLDKLAKKTGLTRTSLCRRFKQDTGESIMDYLLKYRLYQAIKLLDQGTPLATVVRLTGFSTVGWFREKFKKVIGMSFEDYRMEKIV